jgi:hypothetical protein
MDKYEFTKDMKDISLQGGEMEKVCRNMLFAGIEWLKTNKDFDFGRPRERWPLIEVLSNASYKTAEGGVFYSTEIENKKSTMIVAILEHLEFINFHGWEKYCETMKKKSQYIEDFKRLKISDY